tara:strand:- start:390 stop:551 length:162 start_codon:yes stop_codon:yes gene_type:complete
METTEVPLSDHQIKFIMDLMMGCPLGYTLDNAVVNGIDQNVLYKHLESHLDHE